MDRALITRRAALAVAATALALASAEMILRVVDESECSGWRSECVAAERNQLGYRGRQIPEQGEAFVIVLLGDSQVEAEACAFDWMPERRLQTYLNRRGHDVRVVTLGTGGYGQDQQLLALREYFERFAADLVILWLTPRNDVWNNVFPTHWPENGRAKPTFWLDGNGDLRGPTESLGEPVGRRTGLRLAELFTARDPDGDWSESRLPPPYVPLAGPVDAPIDDALQRQWDGGWRERLDTEKSHEALALTPVSPRGRYGLRLTCRLIEAIREEVATHGAAFTAFRTVVPCGGTGPVERIVEVDGRRYRLSPGQRRRNVAQLLDCAGASTIRVTTRFPHVGPADGHLNQHAVDEVMAELADRVHPLVRRR